MTSQIIQQCEHCRRFFAGGELVSVSVGDGLAAAREGRMEMFGCGRDDCGAVEQANLSRDRAGQRRACAPRARRPNVVSGRPEFRSPCPRDTDPLPAEARTQREFEDSGAAANQNRVLIEFFTDPKTHGKMFPMVYLEEISGAKRMNNRAIDLRKYFEPLGFGIWNEMQVYDRSGAMHSHYGIFPIAEVERRERERADVRARRQEEKTGQRRFD